MYLHLGQSVSVDRRSVIGVFDLEITSQSRRTMDFLEKAERGGRLVNVSEELPKSFIVCRPPGGETRVYLSQLAPATLLRRGREPF